MTPRKNHGGSGASSPFAMLEPFRWGRAILVDHHDDSSERVVGHLKTSELLAAKGVDSRRVDLFPKHLGRPFGCIRGYLRQILESESRSVKMSQSLEDCGVLLPRNCGNLFPSIPCSC